MKHPELRSAGDPTHDPVVLADVAKLHRMLIRLAQEKVLRR